MKILAIMGSPKKKGHTYELTRKVEEKMKQLGPVKFEYIFLKDLNLESCRGCGLCFDKGEELCPLKDERPLIEEKIEKADGVIFTSPNYVFNVSGLMKNFIDRFAYVCHRPRFFKNAMALTTSGVGGSKLALLSLSTAPSTWGFQVVESVGVVKNGDPNSDLTTPMEKVDKKVNKSAENFYNAVKAGRPSPSIFSMTTFIFAKKNMEKLSPEYFDYQYWKDHGWLENSAEYYYDPETNFIKKVLARLLSQFMGLIDM
jgi:multimeric flavodoxin WrbA